MSTEFSTVEAADQPKPGQIPVPENFPVTWENPSDPDDFWQVELMHWPDPLTPMDAALMRAAHAEFTWTFNSYGIPLQYNARLHNHYWYYGVTPNVADPSEIPERMGVGLQNVEATIPRLQDLWTTEWLPEVQRHLAYLEEFDLAGSNVDALLAHFEEMVNRHARVWGRTDW